MAETYLPHGPGGIALPDVNDLDTKEFWAACKRHELVVQRCDDCGTFRHSPEPICYRCRSLRFHWQPVSGNGVIYSYGIPAHPVHPAVTDRVPYNFVVVELPDAGNVRMVGNLVGEADADIVIGMSVAVTWEDITDDVALPQWQRAR